MKEKHGRTVFVVLVLIVFASFPLFSFTVGSSEVGFSAGLRVSASPAFENATKSYLLTYPGCGAGDSPAFRTALGFDVDVQILSVSVATVNCGTFSIDGGLSYAAVSRSLPYGASLIKGYAGIGIDSGMSWEAGKWGIRLGVRAHRCTFDNTGEVFPSMTFSVTPGYLLTDGILRTKVQFPLSVAIREDMAIVLAGLGFEVSMPFRHKRAEK